VSENKFAGCAVEARSPYNRDAAVVRGLQLAAYSECDLAVSLWFAPLGGHHLTINTLLRKDKAHDVIAEQ
jgi:hypothetical protein